MASKRTAPKRTVTYSGNTSYYEDKLERVVQRFGGTDLNWGLGREEAWVEFRIDGQLYRFDHSVPKAAARGINLKRGGDAFAQLVLTLEDLARVVERGIYELQTWLSGMRALPATLSVPEFLRFLRFEEIPMDFEDVRDRYRTLSLSMHPDQGGDPEDWHRLQNAMEQATRYYAAGGAR